MIDLIRPLWWWLRHRRFLKCNFRLIFWKRMCVKPRQMCIRVYVWMSQCGNNVCVTLARRHLLRLLQMKSPHGDKRLFKMEYSFWTKTMCVLRKNMNCSLTPTKSRQTQAKCLKKTWLHVHRKDLANQKIQAILRLCKPFRNFHSSTVLLCLCVQEESYSRRSPHPPLAELAPPSASQPAPPFSESLLFGWARDEPVGVRTREPSLLPGPGLDRSVPPVPRSGRVKDRPPYLLLQWASLCHTAWNTAGADLLRVPSSLHRRGETALTPRSLQLSAVDPTQEGGACFRPAVLLYFLWARLCVFDTFECCCFFYANPRWSMIAWKEWKAGERTRRRRGSGLSVAWTAASKWTRLKWTKPTLASCINPAFSPSPNQPFKSFSEVETPSASSGKNLN